MPLPSLPPGSEFQLPPQIQAMLAGTPSTEELVLGRPGGQPQVGLVMKRTYKVGADGRCEPAPDGDQELVVPRTVLYHELEPPAVSPVVYDNDTAAFRNGTDVVVQGYAQSYGKVIDRTTVALAIGDWRREIRVYGNRRAEGAGDDLRFSAPEPFEIFPVRYDFAYGGYDARALEGWENPVQATLKESRPELRVAGHTPFHYPRNPSGRGFLIRADAESVARVQVPNLEFPFDPVTPERLAVGEPERWLEAPLPAGMDWIHPGWFPRLAYLGLAPIPEERPERVPEIDLQWAPPDLLEIPSFARQAELRPEFAQGASPGLVFPQLDPNWEWVLENWHPEQPSWRLRLPDEVPDARLGLAAGGWTPLVPHLNAVVIRPDFGEVVMTWCGRAPLEAVLSEDAALQVPREIHWNRSA